MMKLSFDRLTNALVANFRNTLNKFIGEVEENFTETVRDVNQAKTDASAAVAKADEAKTQSNNTQAQVDALVVGSNTSPAEAVQARVGTDGQTFATLKQRLDNEHNEVTAQLAEKAQQGNRVTTAWDTFNRADGAIDKSEDGQTYLTAGDSQSQLFKIVNKKAVLGTSIGNAYLSLDAGDTIETMGAEWTLESGSTTSTVAVVITNDQTLSLGNLLHFITNSKDWTLQIRKGGSNNQLVSVMNGVYKTPLEKDGVTKHRFEMTVIKEKNTVYMRLPDGDIVSYTDKDVSVVTGSRGYWQIIRRNSTDEEPKFTSFWLTKKDETRQYQSGKENLDTYPAIIKTKEYTVDNSVLKRVFSFTPASAGWYRIFNGVADLLNGTVRLYTDGQYDSTITDIELDINVSAFSSSSPTINQRKQSTFNNGIVNQVRVGNDGSNILSFDINVKSATSPKPIYIEVEGFNLLKLLSNKTQTIFNPTLNPATPTNNVILDMGRGLRTTSAIRSSVVETDFETVLATANVNMNKSISAVDATAEGVTLTLPNSTQNGNHIHTFSRVDGSANTVTVIGYFSDGTTSKTLTRGLPLRVVANPSTNQWLII
ncbi:hypothetical protein [Priestia flexa]|uniref:Uncharacterized protein n=1 Tax=Priestia flexa TaxID=86664 RepID=A0ABU4J2A4_9BACI|nr:hypothetical protein [Priestia flexa]MDW8515131.1 hypothetical protein [Priestia flexa]